jgi:hypothetical protein
VQLGRPPNRIDLLTSIDGVESTDAWAAKVLSGLFEISLVKFSSCPSHLRLALMWFGR